MSSVSAQPFAGLFRAQSATSTFAFAVRHSGVFWFRGTLPDVEATLSDEGDGLVLDGVARAESISIAEPAAMRASVLGAAFFDVEHHPELRFRSTDIRLGEYDRLELYGDLTLRGVTRPVAATGQYARPRQASFGEVAGLALQTTIDRRDFGFDWQMEMPDGGEAVGWDVAIDVDLLLIREDAPDDVGRDAVSG